jgi:hypothetical protein
VLQSAAAGVGVGAGGRARAPAADRIESLRSRAAAAAASSELHSQLQQAPLMLRASAQHASCNAHRATNGERSAPQASRVSTRDGIAAMPVRSGWRYARVGVAGSRTHSLGPTLKGSQVGAPGTKDDPVPQGPGGFAHEGMPCLPTAPRSPYCGGLYVRAHGQGKANLLQRGGQGRPRALSALHSIASGRIGQQ